MTDVAELVRVALREHHAKVSRIVAIALRMLAKRCPGIRLAISFADPSQGHHGGIYQANGWTYTGMSAPDKEYWHGGRWKHSREVRGGAFGRPRRIRLGGRGLTSRVAPGKHRYLMPLDAEMRAQVLPLAKPYPKRERSSESGTPEPTGGDAAMRSARLDQSQTCRVRE